MENDQKLVKTRYEFSNKREKAVVNDALTKLDQALKCFHAGQADEAEAIKQELIDSLKAKLQEYEKNKGVAKKHADFDRSVLPEKGCVLAENDKVILRSVSDADYDNFMAVSYECSAMRSAFDDDRFKKDLWEGFAAEHAANYSIFDKQSGEYVGYCGIKDLTRETWEIAIELLEKFRGKHYGYHALIVMLDSLSGLTGESLYRIRVDCDNYASQGLVKKIGARFEL